LFACAWRAVQALAFAATADEVERLAGVYPLG
jgi:hypothetical protein